jgi:hypothetical protein
VRRSGRRALGLAAGILVAASALHAQVAPPPAPPPGPPAPPATAPAPSSSPRAPAPAQAPAPTPGRPGTPAPQQLVAELQLTLARAVQRFEARDTEGVIAHISDQYRTGPLTKTGIRAQLVGIFTFYEAVRAQVRIDEVRMVGDQAWVWSTGEALGRLPLVGQWMSLFTWERELEVARREGGAWRLFGYQQ